MPITNVQLVTVTRISECENKPHTASLIHMHCKMFIAYMTAFKSILECNNSATSRSEEKRVRQVTI